MYLSSISEHLLAFEFATCCSFSFAFVLLNDVEVETKGSVFDLPISTDLARQCNQSFRSGDLLNFIDVHIEFVLILLLH